MRTVRSPVLFLATARIVGQWPMVFVMCSCAPCTFVFVFVFALKSCTVYFARAVLGVAGRLLGLGMLLCAALCLACEQCWWCNSCFFALQEYKCLSEAVTTSP